VEAVRAKSKTSETCSKEKMTENHRNELFEVTKDFQHVSIKQKPVPFLDLCAGTGAFSLALQGHQSKRFKCVFSNDKERSSEAIYNLNHPACKLTRSDLLLLDLRRDIPKHRLLCAGFPCQPFSIAGKLLGFQDTRTDVIKQLYQVLEIHKPDAFLFENVKHLKSHDKGKSYQIIKEQLIALGYHVKEAILDTNKVTEIPQHRERLFIVGFRDPKLYEGFDFDFPTVQSKRVMEFLEPKVEDKYYYTDLFKSFEEIKDGITKHVSTNTVYQLYRGRLRENKSPCCPTLLASMGNGNRAVPLILDDKGIRRLTPRECFNLQGFPRGYKLPPLSDSALYKLAGNAVSVPVVEIIVNKLEQIMK